MRKAEIIADLKNKGFKTWKKRGGYADCHYYYEDFGNYGLYIYLSNQARIFIETSGGGPYYIKMEEISLSFGEIDDTNILVHHFNARKNALSRFVNDLNELDED